MCRTICVIIKFTTNFTKLSHIKIRRVIAKLSSFFVSKIGRFPDHSLVSPISSACTSWAGSHSLYISSQPWKRIKYEFRGESTPIISARYHSRSAGHWARTKSSSKLGEKNENSKKLNEIKKFNGRTHA